MALWWIGNAIFILVVIPVVLVLLQRLVRPVIDIRKTVTTIHDQAGGISGALDAVPALLGTRDRVKHVGALLTRYVTAVDRLL